MPAAVRAEALATQAAWLGCTVEVWPVPAVLFVLSNIARRMYAEGAMGSSGGVPPASGIRFGMRIWGFNFLRDSMAGDPLEA